MRFVLSAVFAVCFWAPAVLAQTDVSPTDFSRGAPQAQSASQVVGDPTAIAALMSGMGMNVTQGHDVHGLPMLESSVDGTLFNVYFYDCTRLCARMQFVTGFRLATPMTADDANDWNSSNPIGRVVINDSGDPYIEMDIGLAADGLGRKNFEEALKTWRGVLQDFRTAITE